MSELDRLREIRTSLPETSERLSHGAPAFFYREKRCFLMLMDNHHGDGRLAIWCAAPAGVQELLVGMDPEKFFRPPKSARPVSPSSRKPFGTSGAGTLAD